ncbi:hypothetical protein [Peterkaempfera sp. SMS 1(5)a]|uniref:hypothetical protein n=1 Tax=Peterkaempfera podocarpi TaxID=3232308 RepID=UPI00366F64E5
MIVESGDLDETDEHQRFAVYLRAFDQVSEDEEFALVARVLEDPDAAMGGSAVLRHLDRRAESLLLVEDRMAWMQAMAEVVAARPFLVERLHEWSLFRAVTLGQPWSQDALVAASNWLQLKIAEGPCPGEAAVILAEAGRTKRIRNAARVTLNRRDRG